MQTLNDTFSFEDFAARVKRASLRVLMLDYDGTLAPFVEDRDAAVPYPGVREKLTRLMDMPENRVVVISGRSISDLERLLAIAPLPELWGSHGLERRLPDGSHERLTLPEKCDTELDALEEWIVDSKLEDVCEHKPGGAAFHWRGRSDAERREIERTVRGHWGPRVSNIGMAIHEFDGGIELRVAGVNKGDAVETLIKELPRSIPMAYLGDDLTDEDAFLALEGRGARALVRDEPRDTRADVWLKPPDEMLTFLEIFAEA